MKKVLSIMICIALAVGCLAMTTVSASADTKPRYIVLLLDISDSMEENDRLASEKKAAVTFCEAVTKNTNDKIAIVAFDYSTSLKCDFTNDFQTLKSAVDDIKIGGGTDFYSALELADELLVNAASSGAVFERNIVLCSDGMPVYGPSSYEGEYTVEDHYYYYSTANAALSFDNTLKPTTNIYTIGFFQGLTGQDETFAPRFMRDLANRLSVVAENEEELIKHFEEFAEEITKVETPDEPETPAQPTTTTSSATTTTTTTTSASTASAASIAQSITTGGAPIAFAVTMMALCGSVAVIAYKSKREEN